MLPCQNWMRAATSRHRLWYIQARMNLTQDGGTGDRPVQVLSKSHQTVHQGDKGISPKRPMMGLIPMEQSTMTQLDLVLLGLFNGEAVLKRNKRY